MLCSSLSSRRIDALAKGLLTGSLAEHFATPFLEPGLAAFKAAEDGLRAGGETSLEHGEREADGVPSSALAVSLELVGAVPSPRGRSG